ncbi:MAG: hypothetical protein NC400_13145 [Clostridium sp.]|nr:hypothetical protein [Clostridium sp.]
MMSLFDDEQIMKSYIKSERYDAEQEILKDAALTMIEMGKITIEEIENCFPKLSEESIQELEAEIMQLA